MPLTYQTELNAIEDFYTLFESTGWNKEYQLTKQELARVVENSSYKIAAYTNNHLVGFGRIVTDGIMHAMIYDLITDPKFQKQGIGSEILIRLVKECQKNGIRDIQLFCVQGKKIFYEKRGFRARDIDSPGMEYVG